MATTLFFDGAVIAKPGAYTRIDASGLESTGLGANGIVAIVGTSRGGVPVSALDGSPSGLLRLTRPAQVRDAFISGDLREACAMAFNPSNDPNILGGAQVVIPLRVDPATNAAAEFSNTDGTSLRLETRDYGAQANQTNATIANGTVKGRLVTVTFEDSVEAFDNVGGDNMFSLLYTPAVTNQGSWESMNAQILSSGVRAWASRTDTGLATDVINPITAATAVRVTATAGDANKTITIYGLNALNAPARETLTLINGIVSGTQTWNAVYGAVLSAAAAGTVLVEDIADTDDLLSITVGLLSKGLALVSAMHLANDTFVMAADAAATTNMVFWGKATNGNVQSEVIALAGTVPVRTVNSWSQIDVIVLGNTANARTVTMTGIAAKTINTVQDTLQKVVDYYNARFSSAAGFVAEMLTGSSTLNPARLDMTSGAGSTIHSATVIYRADLNAIVNKLDAQSELVDPTRITFAPQTNSSLITAANGATYTWTIGGTAVTYVADGSATIPEIQAGGVLAINNNATLLRTVVASSSGSSVVVTGLTSAAFTYSSGASAGANVASSVQAVSGTGYAPDNTVAPVFLVGGGDGTTTFNDWQDALDLLRQIRVNTVVVLTGDPAVHAALAALCVFKGGPNGKSECDGLVGLSGLDGDSVPTGELPTKAEILAQVLDLNTRHIRACGQSIERFDTFGEQTVFMPWFQAVIGGAMQAGAPVGLPLTNKYLNVLGLAQGPSWNPVDDAEDMIQAGLFFAEEIDGVGRRWVRNITTHLSSDNIAFVEASVNQAVNFTAFELRTSMERIVGMPGFARTITAAKGAAVNKLTQLVAQGIIVAWDALSFTLTDDVLEMSVQVFPVNPVNFVPITMHLNSATITA